MNGQPQPQFRWLERGEGETVILLHSLLGQAHHWDDVLDVLGETCRAIAPTLPVLDPALAEASIPTLAQHVLRLLDGLGIERATVGGSSLGGHVALELALTWPDRVAGLILAGSSGLAGHGSARGVARRPSPEYVQARMEEIFHDPRQVTTEWVNAVHRTVSEPVTALRLLRCARAAKRHNVEARLREIAVPTLLVWGAGDRITPLDIGERFHALIPEAKLVVLPQCGHAPMLERPTAFATVIRRWLNETRRRRGVRLLRAEAAR